MPSSVPKKCSASDQYSLYSEDNLSSLYSDFSKLYEVVDDSNQRPFKECSKRLDRERDRVRTDRNNGYKEEYSTTDEQSIKLRCQFFNRTLCPILLDPSKVEESIPDLGSGELKDEDAIEGKSQWKKKGYAEKYFKSLLNKYEAERKEMSTGNNRKQNKSKKPYSNKHEQRDLDFETQHAEFMKKVEGDPKGSFSHEGAMSLLWTQFNSQISNPSEATDVIPDIVPNTNIMSKNGLDSLSDLVKGISSTIYHKNKIKFLGNTDKFLSEYVAPLSKFFEERLGYLSDFKDYNESDEKKNDDDDDDDDKNSNKVGITRSEEYVNKKWGYANVAIGCLEELIGALKLDIGTIERIPDASDEKQGIFAIAKNWAAAKFKNVGTTLATKLGIEINENNNDLDPKDNGVKLCLLKLIDKAYKEHKKLVNFQRTEFSDRKTNKKDKVDSKELDNESDEQTDVDDVNSGIYSFISGLTNGKISDFDTNKKLTEKELVGKHFISLRARLRLLNDCLDPRFSYEAKNNELEELTKVRKDVKTLLDEVDLKKLGIGGIQDILDTFKDSKKLNEIKDKINGVNDKIVNKMKESNIKNFIESGNPNPQFAKCKKIYDEELNFQKIPDDINDANENVKSYASFSDQDYKNFFEKDLKALKLPDAKKLSLKLIKEIDDDNNTKGKGQEYLKYHAILSFVYQFLNVNKVEANNTNKDKVKYREHFLEDIIKGSIKDESKEFPDKQQIFDSNNIFDISYDYEERNKIKKEIVKLTDLYEGIIKLIEINALKEYRYKDKNGEEKIKKIEEPENAPNNDYFSEYETNTMKEQIGKIEDCFQNGGINNIDKYTKLDEKIKPYIIYDKTLMDKEQNRIENEKRQHDESTKLNANKKKFNDLTSDDQRKWLIDRAKLGFLYLFWESNPFKNNKFFMSSSEKKKYDVSQKKNINEIEELLSKIDIDKILNKPENNNLDEKLKARLDKAIKDESGIQQTWLDTMTGLNVKRKENDNEVDVIKEINQYSSLYNKLSKLKKGDNLKELVNDNDLSKFIFFSDSDWDSEISKCNKKIEEYKKDEKIQAKFKAKQETLKKDVESNKKKTYEELIKNENVKSFLTSKMRLNLIKIYLETNLLGMDYPTDKKLREEIDSIKSIYVNKINGLDLNDHKSVNDIYDILNPPSFEEKEISKDLPDEEQKKIKAEQEKKKKDYEEETKKKKEILLNKYSNISDSAKNIISNLYGVKGKWVKTEKHGKGDKDKNNNGEVFKISDENIKYLEKEQYPIQDNLEKILNQEVDIQNIIAGNAFNDIKDTRIELLKNCMSYDEEDFKKELEEAKKIQKDRQI